MYVMNNNFLTIHIQPKGAELDRIFHKGNGLDYLWSGDPAFWGKKSPVLFPIVGALKKNTYWLNEKPYQLGRHGFAREQEFEAVAQAPNQLVFQLSSSAETKLVYPFDFIFRIRYTLKDEELLVEYEVKNTGVVSLYFSVGGHPAFRVPLVSGTNYEDYYLQFDHPETLSRWMITPEGLIGAVPQPFLQQEDTIALSKALFYQDAIVLKHPVSRSISLRSGKTKHGLQVNFNGFPYLGIWAAREADFVCIEPWCGIADSVLHDHQLATKEGINVLQPGEIFVRYWSLHCF